MYQCGVTCVILLLSDPKNLILSRSNFKSLIKNFKFPQQKLRVIHIAEGRRTSSFVRIAGMEDKERDEVYIARQINPLLLTSLESINFICKLFSNAK